jgi:hypothetical protein
MIAPSAGSNAKSFEFHQYQIFRSEGNFQLLSARRNQALEGTPFLRLGNHELEVIFLYERAAFR